MNRYSVGFYLLSFVSRLALPFFFFFLDLLSLSFLHTTIVHTLASFTTVLVLQRKFSPLILVCIFLLGVFSFLTSGLVLTNLALIGGFLMGAKALSYYCTYRPAIACITVIFFTILPLISSPYLPFLWLPYTIFALTANLMTVYISLKWSPAVKRSNRS